MKKIMTILGLLVGSYSALANPPTSGCYAAHDDASITYCKGEKVLVLKTNNITAPLMGPMPLVSISPADDTGYVELFEGQLRQVLPSLDVAIMRGCNSNGVCVGDTVIKKSRNQIYKVAGLFANGDIAIQIGNDDGRDKPLYLFLDSKDFQKQ